MAESNYKDYLVSDYKDLEELGIDCNSDELTEAFHTAANHLTKLASKLDNVVLLNLYAFYKQGLEGACNTPKPSWYDMRAKSKWEAWSALKNMSQDEAKTSYINRIKEIDPEFNTDTKNVKNNESWVTVSTLQHSEEVVDDSDKTIVDYVKEGNYNQVEVFLKEMKDVNIVDSDGLGLIHWAADRGYSNILQLLLQCNVEVNLRDVDGQTALHYTSSCGHLECCELLLKNGADAKIVDADGSDAAAVAADDTVKELLLKYL